MEDIHHVIIVDNKNAGSYQQLVDLIRPIGATTCFVAIDKFQASIDLTNSTYTKPTHNVCVFLNGIGNAYTNIADSPLLVRSTLLDTFLTDANNLNLSDGITYAYYNVINNKEKWVQLPLNDLNQFQLKLQTASNYGGVSPITYSDISANTFQFFIHLRIRFAS